jgi:cell division protein FtsI/penicillin-binding protein 2
MSMGLQSGPIVELNRRGLERRARRRRRRLKRALPLLALAVVAFAAGVIVGTSSGPDYQALATQYVRAWVHHDFSQMYSMLDRSSRQRVTEAQFASDYRTAATTATLRSLTAVHVLGPNGRYVPVTMKARTAVFGTLHETLLVPYDSANGIAKIRFEGTLLFPGLRPGEQLSRSVSLAPRATLLARNGVALAEGPQRTSPIPTVAGAIVGRLAPVPKDQAAYYAALGYPPGALVGVDGLEHVFQSQLAGRPGGTLRAGSRVLAETRPVRGVTVRTTIDPAVESAAVSALGNSYGGIAAMDPRNGQVLALAGLAFSALQPPGSTMKIVTTTAALQAGLVKLSTTFPIATSANIGGYILHNAGGEACGGTLLNAFAVSCNSVFAPLGVRVGGKRLVAMAERYGFNHSFGIPGAAEPQIPSANKIGDATSVGSSAIGQGQVLSSALGMTDVAATIAMRGRRPLPTLSMSARPRFVPVTNFHVATLLQRMMIAVVQYGTGVSAAIPGVVVAGKTGTAEIGNTSNPNSNNPKNTDAWFVGYAPVGAPRIVAGALFTAAGYGGATAAPAVRQVLIAGLQRR